MTTVPLPGFLPADALDEFGEFDGPLIYLAAPLGHQDPSVSPNPPKGACERRPEEAKGCTFESEIMVLNQKTCHRKGAPNRCYHVTTLTASKSPSTIPAW